MVYTLTLVLFLILVRLSCKVDSFPSQKCLFVCCCFSSCVFIYKKIYFTVKVSHISLVSREHLLFLTVQFYSSFRKCLLSHPIWFCWDCQLYHTPCDHTHSITLLVTGLSVWSRPYFSTLLLMLIDSKVGMWPKVGQSMHFSRSPHIGARRRFLLFWIIMLEGYCIHEIIIQVMLQRPQVSISLNKIEVD